MTKPCQEPLMTIISHSLSIDMLFIIDSTNVLLITSQYRELDWQGKTQASTCLEM